MKLALTIALVVLTGCGGLNPQKVNTIPSRRNYLAMTCEQLTAEKGRIEAAFKELRWSNKPRTREALGSLKGQAIGVDAAAQEKHCGLVPVRIPNYPIRESREDTRGLQ
jgi:hypothetical protein